MSLEIMWGGVLNPIFAAANLGVVIYIAFALERIERERETTHLSIQREHETKKILFEHLRSWNSEVMFRNRDVACSLTRNMPERTLREFDDLSIDDRTALWVVLHFFSDQYQSVRHNIVTAKDAVSLFGSIYTWWDIIAVKGNYPKEWSGYQGWSGFKQLVEENASQQEIEDWKNAAYIDLERYSNAALQKSSTTQDD